MSGGADIAKGNAGEDLIDVEDGTENDTAAGGDGGADQCQTDAGDARSGCEMT
jgi:hypothetical protein